MRDLGRILCIRQDKLGDLVLTTPVFSAIKHAGPEATIGVGAQAPLLQVLELNRDIDARVALPPKPSASQYLRTVRALREGKWDAALLLKPRSRTYALLTRLAGIRTRVGANESRTQLSVNVPDLREPATKHEVESCLEMAEVLLGSPLGRPGLTAPFSDESRELARNQLGGLDDPYLCVHPGTGGTATAWGAERYAEVSQRLTQATGYRCVVTGTSADQEVGERIIAQCGPTALNLLGKTSIGVLTAILASSKLVVCGNTAAAHLAAAHKVCVAMIEPTPDAANRILRWRPWQTEHVCFAATAVCQGCTSVKCHHQGCACLESIDPAKVVTGTVAMLRTSESRTLG